MFQNLKGTALTALKGKWCYAVLITFIASLLGAATTLNFTSANELSNIIPNDMIVPLKDMSKADLLTVIFLILIIFVVRFIISGMFILGYAKHNLSLIDGKEIKLSTLFSQTRRFADGFIMNLLLGVYTLLWSLLLLIPGIIKSYAYAMTPYILAEYPEMSPKQAIATSVYLMDGNKMDLFLLRLSFIGWDMLCVMPILVFLTVAITAHQLTYIALTVAIILCYIGFMIVNTYKEAAQAAFYRSIAYVELDPEEEKEEEEDKSEEGEIL